MKHHVPLVAAADALVIPREGVENAELLARDNILEFPLVIPREGVENCAYS